MEIHDAAELLPLDEESIPELAESIRTSGLIDDVETLDGKVIDGRRRLRACALAGVAPRFRAISTNDPIRYVLDKSTRRNLTPSQWAMVGAKAAGMRAKLDAEAKERQKRKPADGSVQESFPEQARGQVRDQLGELVGVSGRSIDFATKVLADGVPDLVKAVEAGQIAVSAAAVIAAEPPAKQVEEVARRRTPRANRSKPARARVAIKTVAIRAMADVVSVLTDSLTHGRGFWAAVNTLEDGERWALADTLEAASKIMFRRATELRNR